MLPLRTSWARAYPLITFYCLAFASAWLGCLPLLAGWRSPLWLGALLLMGLGPTLAAGLTIRWQGQAGAGRLRALFHWRVAPRWYALALLLPLGVFTTARLLSQGLGLAVTNSPLRGRALGLFVLLSALANPWEEVGWRGFALPRLQARYPPVVAALLVGVGWGLWHVPLFLVRTGPVAMAGLPFGPWALGVLATSCTMAWLYRRAAGSLAVLSLYHIARNGFGALLGVQSYWLLALVDAALALVLWCSSRRKPCA